MAEATIDSCPICLESMQRPKQLQCGHVFCGNCLLLFTCALVDAQDRASTETPYRQTKPPPDEKAESGSIRCPLCRAWHSGDRAYLAAPDASDEMKSAYHTPERRSSSLRELQQGDITCEADECHAEAAFFCQKGCGRMCAHCYETHQSIPLTKKHIVVPVQNNERDTESIQIPCSKHSDVGSKMVCFECPCLPFKCDKCCLEDKRHTHHSFCESLEILQKDLVIINASIAAKFEKVQASILASYELIERSSDQTEAIKGEIRSCIDIYRKNLTLIEEALLEKVDNMNLAKIKPIELQLSDLFFQKTQMEFGLALTRDSLSFKRAENVLVHRKYAYEFLRSLDNRELDLSLPELGEIQFNKQPSVHLYLNPPTSDLESKLDWVRWKSKNQPIDRNLHSIVNMKKKVGTAGGGSGQLQFRCPWGVARHPITGNLYVIESGNHRIQVLTPELEYVSSYEGKGAERDTLHGPISLAISDDGIIAVVDYCNDRVQILDSNFQLVLSLGGKGSQDMLFSDLCHAIFDHDGNLYVSDRGRCDIQKFNKDGVVVTKFGGPDSAGDAAIGQPDDLLLTDDNEICVLSYGGDMLRFFQTDGTFIRRVPIQPVSSYCNLARGPQDIILVSDYGNHKIIFYTKSGTLIKEIGTNGDGDGEFQNPTGIVFGPTNLLYVCDSWNHRIQVF